MVWRVGAITRRFVEYTHADGPGGVTRLSPSLSLRLPLRALFSHSLLYEGKHGGRAPAAAPYRQCKAQCKETQGALKCTYVYLHPNVLYRPKVKNARMKCDHLLLWFTPKIMLSIFVIPSTDFCIHFFHFFQTNKFLILQTMIIFNFCCKIFLLDFLINF